tara:strand:- start:69 stop:680 length:612 start_codon:yes stop_codon:yes gene_type:complete
MSSKYQEYIENGIKYITNKDGEPVTKCTCAHLYISGLYDIVGCRYLHVCDSCSNRCEKKEQMDRITECNCYNRPKEAPKFGCFNCDGCKQIIEDNCKIAKAEYNRGVYSTYFHTEDTSKCNKCACHFQIIGDYTTYMDDICPRCDEVYGCPFNCDDDGDCDFCFKDCKKKNDPSFGYACVVDSDHWEYCDSCKNRFSKYVMRK